MQISNMNTSFTQAAQKFQKDKANTTVRQLQAQQTASFDEILFDTVSESTSLQFSKHASMRLQSRDIKITDEQMERIENGISKAKEKGIKDSLVLVDDIALVVNVKKNIVITALEQERHSENVYTNIDGAVIV